MDDLDNGHKRPFGPHGEGCTCGQDDDELDETLGAEDELEGMRLEGRAMGSITAEEAQYTRVMQLALQATAANHVEHFLAGLDTAAMDGFPLNRRQVIAMLSTLMTGYAEAKETAEQIEFGMKSMAVEARRARLAREAEEAKKPELHSVEDLFTVPPLPGEDEPPDEAA